MAGQLTIDTLKASSGVLATQNGMTGICKAWVNWDGFTSPYTNIRASFNVSSITYVSGAIYRANFTTAMPDANYCTMIGGNAYYKLGTSQTTSYTQIQTQNTSAADNGYTVDQIAVFGN